MEHKLTIKGKGKDACGHCSCGWMGFVPVRPTGMHKAIRVKHDLHVRREAHYAGSAALVPGTVV